MKIKRVHVFLVLLTLVSACRRADLKEPAGPWATVRAGGVLVAGNEQTLAQLAAGETGATPPILLWDQQPGNFDTLMHLVSLVEGAVFDARTRADLTLSALAREHSIGFSESDETATFQVPAANNLLLTARLVDSRTIDRLMLAVDGRPLTTAKEIAGGRDSMVPVTDRLAATAALTTGKHRVSVFQHGMAPLTGWRYLRRDGDWDLFVTDLPENIGRSDVSSAGPQVLLYKGTTRLEPGRGAFGIDRLPWFQLRVGVNAQYLLEESYQIEYGPARVVINVPSGAHPTSEYRYAVRASKMSAFISSLAAVPVDRAAQAISDLSAHFSRLKKKITTQVTASDRSSREIFIAEAGRHIVEAKIALEPVDSETHVVPVETDWTTVPVKAGAVGSISDPPLFAHAANWLPAGLDDRHRWGTDEMSVLVFNPRPVHVRGTLSMRAGGVGKGALDVFLDGSRVASTELLQVAPPAPAIKPWELDLYLRTWSGASSHLAAGNPLEIANVELQPGVNVLTFKSPDLVTPTKAEARNMPRKFVEISDLRFTADDAPRTRDDTSPSIGKPVVVTQDDMGLAVEAAFGSQDVRDDYSVLTVDVQKWMGGHGVDLERFPHVRLAYEVADLTRQDLMVFAGIDLNDDGLVDEYAHAAQPSRDALVGDQFIADGAKWSVTGQRWEGDLDVSQLARREPSGEQRRNMTLLNLVLFLRQNPDVPAAASASVLYRFITLNIFGRRAIAVPERSIWSSATREIPKEWVVEAPNLIGQSGVTVEGSLRIAGAFDARRAGARPPAASAVRTTVVLRAAVPGAALTQSAYRSSALVNELTGTVIAEDERQVTLSDVQQLDGRTAVVSRGDIRFLYRHEPERIPESTIGIRIPLGPRSQPSSVEGTGYLKLRYRLDRPGTQAIEVQVGIDTNADGTADLRYAPGPRKPIGAWTLARTTGSADIYQADLGNDFPLPLVADRRYAGRVTIWRNTRVASRVYRESDLVPGTFLADSFNRRPVVMVGLPRGVAPGDEFAVSYLPVQPSDRIDINWTEQLEWLSSVRATPVEVWIGARALSISPTESRTASSRIQLAFEVLDFQLSRHVPLPLRSADEAEALIQSGDWASEPFVTIDGESRPFGQWTTASDEAMTKQGFANWLLAAMLQGSTRARLVIDRFDRGLHTFAFPRSDAIRVQLVSVTNATPITPPEPVRFRFARTDPTRYVAELEGQGSAWLVLPEKYHPGWTAVVRNARPVGSSPSARPFAAPIELTDHFVANGYANAWYVDISKIGQLLDVRDTAHIEVAIEYRPQRLVEIEMAVSVFVAFGCFGWLAFRGTRRSATRRRGEGGSGDDT